MAGDGISCRRHRHHVDDRMVHKSVRRGQYLHHIDAGVRWRIRARCGVGNRRGTVHFARHPGRSCRLSHAHLHDHDRPGVSVAPTGYGDGYHGGGNDTRARVGAHGRWLSGRQPVLAMGVRGGGSVRGGQHTDGCGVLSPTRRKRRKAAVRLGGCIALQSVPRWVAHRNGRCTTVRMVRRARGD